MENQWQELSWQNWEETFKVNFFHSATGVKPAILIGTKNQSGVANLAIFSSVFHLGSKPPIFGFMVRPGFTDGNTYDNIVKTGQYSFNLFSLHQAGQAHQTAARYAPEINEFEAVGLPEASLNGTPCLANAPLVMVLRYLETIPIKYNDTKIVVGEVISVGCRPEYLSKPGLFNHELAETAGVSGLDTYYQHVQKNRFAYAKPDLPPRALPFDE
jgi:flavin reductase (DIM6/NTAB) family NADH-FMN oxidoreductase RutF